MPSIWVSDFDMVENPWLMDTVPVDTGRFPRVQAAEIVKVTFKPTLKDITTLFCSPTRLA